MSRLERKYAPKSLAELRGQPHIVRYLTKFVADPAPQVFMFSGGSGVGKTMTGRLLAAALGADPSKDALGGFHQIPAGQQTAESVIETFRGLALRPMFSKTGWKVLTVDEADRMSPAAENIWLGRLEQLPARSVIVFTTNHPEKLPQRIVNRCTQFAFNDTVAALSAPLKEFSCDVWEAETGSRACPIADAAGHPRMGDWNPSFRLALRDLDVALMSA
jgi:replication-associated recombination protein RarA